MKAKFCPKCTGYNDPTATECRWCHFLFPAGAADRPSPQGIASSSGSASAAVAAEPPANNPGASPQPARPDGKGGNESLDLSRAVQLPVSDLGGVALIASERLRQISEEGWMPAHDDTHSKFQLTLAAICYAEQVADPDEWAAEHGTKPQPVWFWPWAKKWWKPSDDPIRNLVKAGALIAAEIDRLQRKQANQRHPAEGVERRKLNDELCGTLAREQTK